MSSVMRVDLPFSSLCDFVCRLFSDL
uniref:Uncharacterized protein n=1 Tax=Arundo donax TaxID=35708 RepID=A0A0A8ZGH1_ARUDO